MSISIPESLRKYVAHKIECGDYGSASEYIRELIRADRRREMDHLDEMILRERDYRERTA